MSFTKKLVMSGESEAPKIVQEGMNYYSHKFQDVINEAPAEDAPFIVAAITSLADMMPTIFDDASVKLGEDIKKNMVSVLMKGVQHGPKG